MGKTVCTHGSVARLQLHLHWCRSCASWRHYSFRSFWRGRARGALHSWSDPELVGMGELSLEQTDPEELLAFIRQLLVRCQAVELEAIEERRTGGERQLLERLLASPRGPDADPRD